MALQSQTTSQTVANGNYGSYLYVQSVFWWDPDTRKYRFNFSLILVVPSNYTFGSWQATYANSANLTANGIGSLGAGHHTLATYNYPEGGDGTYGTNGAAPSYTVSWAFNVNSSWGGYVNPHGSATFTGVSINPANYTVTYNANGGQSAPAAQTKVHGTNLTLTTEEAVRAEEDTPGFTVTFNGNGGTPDYPNYTATDETYYNFVNWNTKSDGSGTTYEPGDTYTANANLTLYAQYYPVPVRGTIKLPGGSKNGYVLRGWTRDLTTEQLVEDNYTALGDETLYAVWSEKTKLVNARVSGGWSGNVVKVKINGNWVPVIDIKTSW